ncbi:MAG: hypothetical protein VX519_00225 [Myxococcota bacterium]|nr:hypothetical protein [Myxococcota bacterium]
MSMVDLGLWLTAGVLLLVAGWNTLPRPPELNWELYFKVVITSLIRGEIESKEGTADEWFARGRALAWFHPGARDLELKITAPESYEVSTPAIEGERGLVEALLALKSVRERLEHTFSVGSADAVLYEDPALLGGDYDPRSSIGTEADWEAVAQCSSGLVTALRRRHEHLRWVVMGGEPLQVEALAGLLGEDRVIHLSETDPESAESELEGFLQHRSDRLVLLAFGVGAELAVRMMHASPGLRDRVLAVVGVGAALGGEAAIWLGEEFGHQSMDTEISRLTSWFHVAFVTPDVLPIGDADRPLTDTRWPQPPVPSSGRNAIESIDLGVLPGPASEYPPELLIRSLVVTVTARLGTG